MEPKSCSRSKDGKDLCLQANPQPFTEFGPTGKRSVCRACERLKSGDIRSGLGQGIQFDGITHRKLERSA